jgi:hypothetical protein
MREVLSSFSSPEDQENVVGKNGEVKEEETYDDGPGDDQALVDAKEHKAQRG